MTKHYSLRRHLLTLISTPVILGGLLIGGLATGFIYKEIGEVYDAQLVQTAKLLFQLTHHELTEEGDVDIGNINGDISHIYEKNLAFRIWKDGKLVTESASAGAFGSAPSSSGFSVEDDDGDGQYWRNFVYDDKAEKIVVEVAENNEVRTELILQIISCLFLPALFFVPLILFCVWWGTTQSLKPLVALAGQVNARGSHDLTPLQTDKISEEVSPFMDALNRLFGRVDEALSREREFTDNAAHELRTPLAAMKTQIQVLLRKDIGEEDKKNGLDNLHAAVNRASQMVEQLLSFARLQHSEIKMEPIDLSALGEDVFSHFAKAHESRFKMKKSIKPGVEISGNTEALSILIFNVLDNAAKYGPENGVIEFIIAKKDGQPFLQISDEGPGIQEDLKDKIFERFFRIDKSAGAGSGLGLSMVRWIADIHSAKVIVSNLKPKGLSLKVLFLG